METCAVMVVPCPERAEEILLAGDMPCPRCRGVLRPFGTGRTRTVRGVGADTETVTPRRARCADCQVTQILLPTELLVRRADSTAAIGNALVAKAGGAGFRSIAARFGRPESTVRRWLRAVREPHAQWLYQRGVHSAVLVDVELLDRPAAAADHPRARAEPARRRGRAAAGQLRHQRPGVVTDRILRPRAAPGPSAPASQLKFGSGRALPCPAPPVTMPTNPAPRKRNDRHIADQAVTLPTKTSIPVCTFDDVFNRRFNDGQHPGSTTPVAYANWSTSSRHCPSRPSKTPKAGTTGDNHRPGRSRPHHTSCANYGARQ